MYPYSDYLLLNQSILFLKHKTKQQNLCTGTIQRIRPRLEDSSSLGGIVDPFVRIR